MREELKSSQAALQALLDTFEDFKSTYEDIAKHVKSQAQQTEAQIKEQFEKLHQFLREEEEARITALREEEEEKTKRMKEKITEADKECSILDQLIQETEDMMEAENECFFQNYQDISERAHYTTASPQLDSEALIDVTKHLGNLTYRVWEKMKDICPYFPVILDPNTARETMRLSEDLVSLSGGHPSQDLPDNPERFRIHPVILGSEGFDSGTHSWVVEVKESTTWIIGVAKESVKRKETCKAAPAEGIWTISFRNNKYSWTHGKPTTKYQTFRIQLNWDAGEVKFFKDGCSWVLHSYKDRFTEKIYPFFHYTDDKPLKILPAKVTVQHPE
ncbi:nuclear factor 7, ovary-like [Colossoma macropomum]|uniref:nuclear factor 7, ovary-like n=1 Tax=Colossoma macropomum TaxID=42526 RepID=UPI00186463F4|nr:nuclear factor 7, ovary-like [Colossoma macropomum]